MNANKVRYNPVSKHAVWYGAKPTLREAAEFAELLDQKYPEDAPHTVHRSAPALDALEQADALHRLLAWFDEEAVRNAEPGQAIGPEHLQRLGTVGELAEAVAKARKSLASTR